MRSLADIIKQNKKASFQRQCEEESLKRFNKRYQDLTDAQCAKISKDVKAKILL
jgi:ribosome recycling factor